MKRRDLLAAWTLNALTPAFAAPAAAGEAVVWPEVTLLDGRRWAATPGHAVVVVFWSTTCPFCKRHNQHVEKLHVAAGRGLQVLGVALERDVDALRRYAAAQGYSFPITPGHAPLAAALTARRMIPLTVTVDRQGRLKQVIPGEMFEDDVLDLVKLAS